MKGKRGGVEEENGKMEEQGEGSKPAALGPACRPLAGKGWEVEACQYSRQAPPSASDMPIGKSMTDRPCHRHAKVKS